MTLSFICSAYNHERFAERFLQSLLHQTDAEWELVVVDDHSQDRTADIIASCRDSRIKFLRHARNMGMAAGFNDALSNACGELVSFIGSDDELMPTFVADMKSAFAANAGITAAYAPLESIDVNGDATGKRFPLPYELPVSGLFAEIFVHRNCLPSPGMTVRRSCLHTAFPIHEGLLQHADTLLQLNVLLKGDVLLLKTPLVRYRTGKRGKSIGASTRTDTVKTREAIEVSFLMDWVAGQMGNDVGLFLRKFGHLSILKGVTVVPETVQYWLSRIALASDQYDKRVWGARHLLSIMRSRTAADSLYAAEGFDFARMLSCAGDVLSANVFMRKFRKYRKLSVCLGWAVGIMAVAIVVLAIVAVCK